MKKTIVRVVDAACYGEDHFSHPYCFPNWEAEVEREGGVVVADPALDAYGAGWKALVAFPEGKGERFPIWDGVEY